MTFRKRFLESVPIITCILAWPLILLSEKSVLISKIYYWFLFTYSKYLFHDTQEIIKRRMFQDLHAYKAVIEHDIRLLEIGPGDGENFAYYPSNTKITTVEYSSFVEEQFPKLAKKYSTLVLEKSYIGSIEDMRQILSGSFDVIVGTHILCCVNDPSKALQEIHRILRPKGMFFTQEIVSHLRDEDGKRSYQEWYSYFWSFFTLGCRAGNQEVFKLLRSAGFNISLLRRYETPQLPTALSLTHFGTAVKL